MTMVIFISGSVNAGKSTTAEVVAKKLHAMFIDFDEVGHEVPDFVLEKDIPKVISKGIAIINELTDSGKTVVANYVLRPEDYEQLKAGLHDNKQYYFTLAPRLDVAKSDRGRGINDWESQRIQHHYDTGIHKPGFGEVIDNSDLTLDETADKIIKLVQN